MNKIANRTIINNVLVEEAAKDKNIVVLCSDSRGSADLGIYSKTPPKQFVEVDIAEQNFVSIAAGLAQWLCKLPLKMLPLKSSISVCLMNPLFMVIPRRFSTIMA